MSKTIRPGVVATIFALFFAPAQAVEPAPPTQPSIELQLSARDFGNHYVVDASGDLLFELTPPYRDAPNTSDILNPARSMHQPIGNLYVWNPAKPNIQPKLLAGDRHMGVWIGSAAPDGEHVALYSAKSGVVRPGILDAATKRTRWLDFTPVFDWLQQDPVWVSNKTVVFPALPPGEVPGQLFLLQLRKKLENAWAANANGSQAQPTVISSGRLGPDRVPEPRGSLISVDVTTGKQSVLGDGLYYNPLASPNHINLAALRDHGIAPKKSQKVDLDSNDYEIVVFNVATGEQTHPCPDCTVSMPTLQWSSDGASLTFFASPRGESREKGDFYRYTIGSPKAAKVSLPGLTIACSPTDRGPSRIYPAGDGVFAYAVLNSATSPFGEHACNNNISHNWYFVGWDGVVKSLGPETTEPASPWEPASPVAGIGAKAITAIVGGKMFSLSSDGTAKRIGESIAEPIQLLNRVVSVIRSEAAWSLGNTPSTDYAILETGKSAVRLDVQSGELTTLSKEREGDALVTASSGLRQAVFLRTTNGGALTLYYKAASGVTHTVDHINDFVENIRPPQYRELTYDFNGQKLTSLIMLPTDWAPGKPLPTIVDIYPSSTGACRANMLDAAGPFIFIDNSLFTAKGYAVLCPADPTPLARTKTLVAANLTALVLAAVDASIAAGYTDPDRLGLFGFSQGFHRALTIATQTCRFSAVVAGNGLSDFASQYGDIPYNLLLRTDPSEGPASGAPRFELNSATGADVDYVGGTPWDIPDVYRENSPYYYADGVTAPILITHSEFDQFALSQSAEMFSALFRLNKDAQYVVYWGEGHGNLSPNNVRDYWNRVLGWYDTYLNPAHSAGHGASCHEAVRPFLK